MISVGGTGPVSSFTFPDFILVCEKRGIPKHPGPAQSQARNKPRGPTGQLFLTSTVTTVIIMVSHNGVSHCRKPKKGITHTHMERSCIRLFNLHLSPMCDKVVMKVHSQAFSSSAGLHQHLYGL